MGTPHPCDAAGWRPARGVPAQTQEAGISGENAQTKKADQGRKEAEVSLSASPHTAAPGILVIAIATALAASCDREPYFPTTPPDTGQQGVRLTLNADATSGTVPLTVNFTGSLKGPIDTLSTLVPESSLEGGYNPEEALYTPVPDTTAKARGSYQGREHYFRQGTYSAVMIVHGLHGDILSDTVTITVF
jgi:hypothetical protein